MKVCEKCNGVYPERFVSCPHCDGWRGGSVPDDSKPNDKPKSKKK